jgi:hypothetical protein
MRWRNNRRRLRLWQSALALCKVSEVESSGFWAWRARLTARSEPLQVWITGAGGSDDRVEVIVEGAEGFSDLKLRRQSLKLWKREIEVGDEAFDKAFLVEGPLRPVAARLDGTLRGQLLRASADCNPLEIGDGQLRVEVSEKALPRLLPALFRIGRRLAGPVDVERQIAQNARRDRTTGVRLFNLLLLIRERPGDPDTLAVLRGACSDASPKVRVRAAIELGEEGRDVLLKVTEKLLDDASSAQAVVHLGDKLPLERLRKILSRSRRKSFLQTTRACLEALGQRRAAAVELLAQVMAAEKGELAAAAAVALGTTGEAAAERPLLQALGNEDSDLREAAAAALGRVGSVAAVQPLKDAAERFWLDLGLRRAARQAIVEIQSRLEGASPGQLSLAETEAGQLSLATPEAGQLSLAQDEIGRLAFPPEEQEQPPHRARETPGVRQG